MPLLYVLILITSLECPGFTQAIVQFDKSIFTLDVNPLSDDLAVGKLDLALIDDWLLIEVVFYFGELFGVFWIQETVRSTNWFQLF